MAHLNENLSLFIHFNFAERCKIFFRVLPLFLLIRNENILALRHLYTMLHFLCIRIIERGSPYEMHRALSVA